jgi:uncharacterized protein (DUF1778 family)
MPTARTRATRKFNEKAYDRLYTYVKKGQKEIYEDAAKKAGMTLNEFICAAIDEKIERMNNLEHAKDEKDK